MAQKILKRVVIGTAVGSILATLGALAANRRADIVDRFRSSIGEVRPLPRNHLHASDIAFGVLGFLVGAGSALFLTPQREKQVRNHIAKVYHNAESAAHKIIAKRNELAKIKKRKPTKVRSHSHN